MTASLNPKFFQILPTRALSGSTPAAGTLRGKSRAEIPVAPDASLLDRLKQRLNGLRMDMEPARREALIAVMCKTLTELMNENWQTGRRILAQITGDAQAIAIIGPLSESSEATDRLMAELDENTLSLELTRLEADMQDRPSSVRQPVAAFSLDAPASQSIAHVEPALDKMERLPPPPTALEHACIVTVKALIRERCAHLVAPVRQKIEKELSFEMAATSEVTRAPTLPPLPSTGGISSNVETVIARALHDHDLAAIAAALSEKTGIDISVVQDAFSGRNARAITALCWKSDLPAPIAAALAMHIALIPPQRAIQPAADGSYALTARELHWQLDFLKEKCTSMAA
ncbi:DUF2336 domain-containing protein [Acetobacter estunensis]|uniref:DUF2336 domain-containing protein n=1 Tax=Acetobacter estunensis TaxID=104097 RepID=UPI001C2D1F71|nr:DUF2336 domain-containing protein [Acetobacter estunensis]MBV1836224.1 DUF2336 domain-containing protein [Acetobacter estunensis]